MQFIFPLRIDAYSARTRTGFRLIANSVPIHPEHHSGASRTRNILILNATLVTYKPSAKNEFGWDHLLSARGIRLDSPNNINSYDGFGRNVDLSTSKYGPKNIKEITKNLQNDTTRPHLYAERHTFRRKNFNLDIDNTRRLLWYQILAGGMGGWFGFYVWSEHPYPRQDQLRTIKRFWENRFAFDMEYDPNFHNEIVMRTGDDRLWVVYGEDTDTFEGKYIQNFLNAKFLQ